VRFKLDENLSRRAADLIRADRSSRSSRST
jgi:hypothetical protein